MDKVSLFYETYETCIRDHDYLYINAHQIMDEDKMANSVGI